MIWRSDLARTDQSYRSGSSPDQTTIRSKAITEEEKSDRNEKTSGFAANDCRVKVPYCRAGHENH
ncbi:hypothetical protein PMI09_00119 [Rhizobium sp. CF122]|nr:hypothetical protein PMI09_00119 [Rhizobium sp. CF122]